MPELRRSIALSAAESYIGVVIQLASTVVLSRILTPNEVGAFAVAAVFAALASNFRDFGIAEYLIQLADISDRHIRAAFAVNIITSWSMGALIFLMSSWAGDFYKSGSITEIMRIQAFNFLLIPFGAINMAWFRRQLDFKPLFYCGVGSSLLSLAVSIGLALNGFGALSLAWSSLAGIVATVCISMLFRPAGFPRMPSLAGAAEVFRFGGVASGIYVLAQLGKGAPDMIIGRVQGVTAVALFSRAGGLVTLFRQLVIKAITPVCLPYFAQAVRTEQSVHRAYIRGTAIFTVIGWTFLGFLALAAFPVIRIVYGDQWADSVPLARILCIAGAVELAHYLAKDALLAHGHVKLATQLQFTLQAAQLVGLAAVIPFGLIGACWGLLAASVVGVVLSQWFMHAGTSFRWAQLISACWPSLWISTCALAPMAIVLATTATSESNYIRHLALSSALTIPAWLLALRLSGHVLWGELQGAWQSVCAYAAKKFGIGSGNGQR